MAVGVSKEDLNGHLTQKERRMDGSAKLIVAVVVAFESDLEELRANLNECSRRMKVVICDNSADESRRNGLRELARSQGWHYLPMGGNRGIGYAQNRGIQFAHQSGAEFVLLIDDDSRLTSLTVEKLLDAYYDLAVSGQKVAVVCARPVDRYEGDRKSASACSAKCSVRRDLMSSGSLIPISVVHDVGLMDESLFVDFVDFDWGWRAISRGYKLYRVEDAVFSHALGEGIRNILGIKLKLKSPVRHYYQTRNTFRMLHRPYVPFLWKARQLPATLMKCLLFPFLVPPRRDRALYIIEGLKDGLWPSR